MSNQQLSGLVTLAIGVIALILSSSAAWILARASRRSEVASTWLVTLIIFILFAVGIALCYFGVSGLIEGGA